jgi:hypothetical protein
MEDSKFHSWHASTYKLGAPSFLEMDLIPGLTYGKAFEKYGSRLPSWLKNVVSWRFNNPRMTVEEICKEAKERSSLEWTPDDFRSLIVVAYTFITEMALVEKLKPKRKRKRIQTRGKQTV